MNKERGVVFFNILREKVWQTVTKVNENSGSKHLITNLFKNDLFTEMERFIPKLNQEFLNIKTVSTKCEEIKRFKSKKYQNDAYEKIENIKKEIVRKGLHPILK